MSEERVPYIIMDLIPQSSYVDVRYPDGALAFRFDVKRMIVEMQSRGKKHYFDLRKIYEQGIDKLK